MTKPVYLLLTRCLSLGGIETLVVRLTNALCDQGYRVVVVSQGGVLQEHLDPAAVHLSFDKARNGEWRRIASQLASFNAPVMHCVSFDPLSRFALEAVAQAMLRQRSAIHLKHVSGCFYPRAYRHEDELWARCIVNRHLANYLGNHNLFFINEVGRSQNQRYLKGISDDAPLFPIPVRVAELSWQPRGTSEVLEIVSVGRLVAFKQYIFGVVEAVNGLRAKGIAVRLTIYGHGILEQRLTDFIATMPYREAIQFKGALPYESFDNEVREYDLFIGVGTAATEAVALGIPSLVAIDYDRDHCYGYMHQLPLGTTGEVLDGRERIAYAAAIEAHIALSSSQRQEIGMQARALYKSLSMVGYASRLEDFLQTMKPLRYRAITNALLKAYFWVFYQAFRALGNLLRSLSLLRK